MIGFVLIGTFFFLLLMRVPVAASMGLAAFAGIINMGFKISVFPTVFYAAIAKYTMLAIPFFIVAGVIMDYAGISSRLINFANACVGHRKGGLAVVTVIVACFFAAISGSGPATVAAIGGVLIPAMVRQGYNKDFATALVASSGGIGMIIPPSIPFIIYAMLAEVSVGTMFIAGIIPGILFGVFFSVAALIYLRNDDNVIQQEKQPLSVRIKAFKDALWAIMMPVIILGGIYGGIFTPTEAAGVAVVYGLFVGIVVYREIKLRQRQTVVLCSERCRPVVDERIWKDETVMERVAVIMNEKVRFEMVAPVRVAQRRNTFHLQGLCFHTGETSGKNKGQYYSGYCFHRINLQLLPYKRTKCKSVLINY